MTTEKTPVALMVLESQLKDTKAAYQRGMPGVTYEDMAAAARRLLEMRACYEKASGRPVKTKVTKGAIAGLLRSSL